MQVPKFGQEKIFQKPTKVVDITDNFIWVTYGSEQHLQKWDINTGEAKTFSNLPCTKIWHVGTNGSLINSFPDQNSKTLV